MRDAFRSIAAVAIAACGQAAMGAGDWQCATIGVGAAPAVAEAASGFLDRAGEIYPSQLLGVVQSGGRIYLVNAKDDGWSERVRLGLMELRLAEPDITAARRFQGSVSGAAPLEIPAGDYACLARERAGRQGLALDERGRMFLAPGRSVHLVDPREWSVVVEVKAVGNEPLDFREILALSGRSGIYAGLTSQRARSGGGISVQGAGGVIEVAIGPTGRPNAEVVVTPRAGESADRTAVAAAAIPAVITPVITPVITEAPPAKAPVTVASVVVAESPVLVAKADTSAALPPVQQLPPSSPPAPVVTLPRASATQPARSAAVQSYDDYARAMKSLLALRRSGGVRSVSEMTYVHPAIEDWRNGR